ncbi:MAG: TlpA family protein disulfide reductase [Acidobacteria bacterium]|nr:TlpA family protein disulfide reductase [Acidobacteriota bacterium]
MTSRKQRKVPVAGIVFGAIAVVLVGVVTFAGDTSGASSETGEPTVEGTLAPLQQGMTAATDPMVGAIAPTIVGADFDGTTVTIEAGAPTAVIFLAHWCQFCQAEVPAVQGWLDATGGVDGVDIISVVTSVNPSQGNYPPSKWLERERWTPPVLLDDTANNAYRAYGGTAFPYWVFIDGDGRIIERRAGGISIPELEAILQTLKG